MAVVRLILIFVSSSHMTLVLTVTIAHILVVLFTKLSDDNIPVGSAMGNAGRERERGRGKEGSFRQERNNIHKFTYISKQTYRSHKHL